MTELRPKQIKPDFLSRPLMATAHLDWEKITYIAFIILAIITRLWGVGARVMSHDESLHTQFSLQFFNGDGYNHTPLMHGPFLFHITAASYWLLGADDFTARLPVALFGVLLVAIPYLLRDWIGKTGALFVSFLFLISPFVTYYSRYIRHDVYVIVWALIIFISSLYYMRERKDKYLWWFAAGLALMFATKEVSFIYVAIFGSFLVIRLFVQLVQADWIRDKLPELRQPLALLAIALVMLIAGFGAAELAERAAEEVMPVDTTTDDQQGFAADPNAATEESADAAGINERSSVFRVLQVVGLFGVGLAVFLGARALRPHIDEYPEFDLITLYSTLILPTVSPLVVNMAGFNARDYTFNQCFPPGIEEMSLVQQFFTRLTNGTCWNAFFTSGIMPVLFFLLLMLGLGLAVGFWWNRRRFLSIAIIFHVIFIVLYTSVFTNPGGWLSGMAGSLGYWLEQQEVQRGNQPWFYYFFVVPFYEFLPLIFSLLAVRFWAHKQRVNQIVSYWVSVLLIAMLTFSLGNFLLNLNNVWNGVEPTRWPGLVVAGIVLFAAILYWFMVRRRTIMERHELKRSWRGLVDPLELVGFVPMVTWWLILTWVAYSVAGEKMPWLSIHFVIPMAMLVGWYFQQKFDRVDVRALFSRPGLALIGLTTVFILAIFFAISPWILDQIQLGNQELDNLSGLGRFLGSIIVVVGLYYLLNPIRQRFDWAERRMSVLLSVFILMSLLTIRFTYMANFVNADYTTEFMVYAHAAPAVKETIMPQIDELSQRMNGDLSIRVSWDDDSTWPMQWYLKDYDNRNYYARSPNRSITDSPVIIAGSLNWDKVEPILGDDYEVRTYTFLWWPIEDYRQINWYAIFGLQSRALLEGETRSSGRGLANGDVRQALWDIFFYRDYDKYSEVFGGTRTAGEWPLRHDLRLYIRRDVLANLWDYGVGAAAFEPPVDPYEQGELILTPSQVIGSVGAGDGQLMAPRNIAIGPDGNLYVADSGNHRIQVFDPDGNALRSWGGFGSQAGMFNEPWGIAVDEAFVYVADTWNHRVQKFTIAGEFITTIGQSGTVTELGDNSDGFFFGPRDIILLPDNRLMVTDTGNHRLQIFDRVGSFIEVVGSQGTFLGQFNEPVGLELAPSGGLYLADTWNGRIQSFTGDFLPIADWMVDAWEGNSTNNKPFMAIDNAGNVYVTDPENYRVLIFDPAGLYLGRFGQFSTGTDGFGLPNGIAIDANNNLYIADAGNSVILRFTVPELRGAPPTEPVDIEIEPLDDTDSERDEGESEEEAPSEEEEQDAGNDAPPADEESGEEGNDG